MMEFRAFFCDPVEADIIDLGDMAQDTIMDTFEKVDWNEYLQKSSNAKLDEIYFHPTFGIENKKSGNGITISVIGEPENYKFKVTYKSPQKVKSFLGLNDQISDNYSTVIQATTKNDAIDCLNALLRNDIAYLESRVGR
ncbi:hypothetical protein GVN20_09775 [Runella sp. CRIBMP]|uniref:hypothetical protein n=1 Tax=Runella sp. CRIBMP TaxID=2683261 RepID=UPI0014136982|nr:hypothetical protein [Runella sp. CRIBMP]NBB19639.1 hypothetical protein [Runella sp. CRIBMP]